MIFSYFPRFFWSKNLNWNWFGSCRHEITAEWCKSACFQMSLCKFKKYLDFSGDFCFQNANHRKILIKKAQKCRKYSPPLIVLVTFFFTRDKQKYSGSKTATKFNEWQYGNECVTMRAMFGKMMFGPSTRCQPLVCIRWSISHTTEWKGALSNTRWLSLSDVSLSINWFMSNAFCIFANSEQILICIGIGDVRDKCIRCGQHKFETDCRRCRCRWHRATVVVMLICKRSLVICIA